jgi:nucleoid-associated protein YgaU
MDPVQAFLQANSIEIPLFPATSRYHGLQAATWTRADGTTVAYIRRRFVPPPERFTLVQEHVVAAGDRLDNLAAAYLGDPQQYWRICDANRAILPDELTETVGRRLRITLPEGLPGGDDAR